MGHEIDITDRRAAEEALRESEERYRTAIERSNDGVAILKGDRHLYVNQRFADIFGYESNKDLIGEPLSLIVHPDDLQMVADFASRRQKGESVPSKYEFKGIRRDGEPVNIEVSVTRTTYGAEAVSLAYLRDITDRKRIEEERENLIRELQNALAEVKTLSGLLPICASCKKIRDDKGYWSQIETYIRDHSEADFSHSICPECTKELYPQFYKGD